MNERAVRALQLIVAQLGGSLPTPAGQHWNQYSLDLIDAAIRAAGGSPAARVGPWGSDLAVALEKLTAVVAPASALATMSFATGRVLADYTESDPLSIKLSSANTSVNGTAGYIAAGLTNNAIPSSLPAGALGGLSWSITGKQLGGQTLDADIIALLAACLVWAGDDAPAADVVIGAAVCDAPAASATTGFGVRLSASGGRWLVSHLACQAGVWTATAATATSASVVGGVAHAEHLNNTTGRSIRAHGVDSAAAPVVTANTQTVATSPAVGNNLNTLVLYTGWLTGLGAGTNGTVVRLAGHEASVKVTEITGYSR